MSDSDFDNDQYESASQVYLACRQEKSHRLRRPLADRIKEATKYLLSRNELIGDDDISFICQHFGLKKEKDALMSSYVPLYVDMMKNRPHYNNNMMLAFAALEDMEHASRDDPFYMHDIAVNIIAKEFKVNATDLSFYYGQERNAEGKKKCSIPVHYKVTFGNFSFPLGNDDDDCDNKYFYPTLAELKSFQNQRKERHRKVVLLERSINLNYSGQHSNSSIHSHSNNNIDHNTSSSASKSGRRSRNADKAHDEIRQVEEDATMRRSRQSSSSMYSDYIFEWTKRPPADTIEISDKLNSSSFNRNNSGNKKRKRGKTNKHSISPVSRPNPNPKVPESLENDDDEEEFVVESVLDDRPGRGGKRACHEFKVRWEGYSPNDDSWVPWSVLRYNVAAHDYLKGIGKAHWIPFSEMQDKQEIGEVEKAKEEEKEITINASKKPQQTKRKGEYYVEKIVSHRKVHYTKLGEQKTRFEFRVRWEGYDKTFDEWKAYSELKYNVCLHDYCRKFEHLKAFIPKIAL